MAYARIEAEKTRLSRMRHTFKEERRASARHAVRLVCDRQGAAPLRCAVYVPDELPPQRASELRARGQFELHGRVITWLKIEFQNAYSQGKPRMCVFSLFLHLAVDNARGFVIDWR